MRLNCILPMVLLYFICIQNNGKELYSSVDANHCTVYDNIIIKEKVILNITESLKRFILSVFVL